MVQGHKYVLVNTYAPNTEKEQLKFFESVYKDITEMEIESNTSYIWGGDFNCVLSYRDSDNTKFKLKYKSVTMLENIMESVNLIDIWRIRNPFSKEFTWRANNPLVQRRLDYFLISDRIQSSVSKVYIKPAIATDHSAIFLEIEINYDHKGKFGPSHWRLNLSLLEDPNYIELINKLITNIIDQHREQDSRTTWEFLKYKIRQSSITFSKDKIRKSREHIKILQEQICIFEKSLNEELISKNSDYLLVKQELEECYDKMVEGAIIRSRVQWYEHGEKSSKYFFSLEQKNKIKSSVRTILSKDGSNNITDPNEILMEIKDFFRKKSCKKYNNSEENCFEFIKNVPVLKLSTEASTLCSQNISLAEVKSILNTMSRNKAPGNDGLPVEFYLVFFDLLGPLLTDCINQNYEEGNLTNSQRQAVVSLFEKPSKDNRLLKNWRPISLINVDAKVISKILATRLQHVLPNIVHENQYAFVKNRTIEEALRLISDILDYTARENIPGIMFAADYAAAFDSLDHNFILSSLKLFNFPEYFIKWIRILQTDMQSSVINNGYSTGYFPVTRGCRQGDPISPYIFILAIEILFVMIQNDQDIKGIKVSGLQIKVIMFADDTTFFLKDIHSLKKLENIISIYEKFTSLQLNNEKSEIAWLGPNNGLPAPSVPYKWIDLTRECIKILGIYFTYNAILHSKYNFDNTIERFKSTLRHWKLRNLTLYGKVTIVKTLGIPQIRYDCMQCFGASRVFYIKH